MKKYASFCALKLKFCLLLLLILGTGATAQTKKTKPKSNRNGRESKSIQIEKLVQEDSVRLTNIFKDIHANPELGFMEVRTAAIVAKELRELGYEVTEKIGITGVVGILKNGEGPVVMYRADMDCNAVRETTGLPYASTKLVKREDGSETPVMDACGHDAHTTWLIGVAITMYLLKAEWKGTLVLVAQPAEEPILGAEAMVNDGMYQKGIPEPDYLYGMHTAPVPVGVVSAARGTRMAGTDQIDVTFRGLGGHGSNPQFTKDPIIMASAAIMQYQAIISRALDPQRSAVLTVGSIVSGSDNNVIPATALVKINLRWFNDKDRKLMIDGIIRINNSIAYAYNMPDSMLPIMQMKGWAYPLSNSDTLTTTVIRGLQTFIPDSRILKEDQVPAVMGSEDFHHLVIHNEKKNYCYVLVGIVKPEVFMEARKKGMDFPYTSHNGDYIVHPDAIPFGTKIATAALLEIFNAVNK